MVQETRHTARFGARYGVSVKKRYEAVEQKQRKMHPCPKCGFLKVKRVSAGIFYCKKCHTKYAGGAFYPQTLSGGIIAKMVSQKAFGLLAAKELESVSKMIEHKSPSSIPIPVELSEEERIESLTQTQPSKKERRKKSEVETPESENPISQNHEAA